MAVPAGPYALTAGAPIEIRSPVEQTQRFKAVVLGNLSAYLCGVQLQTGPGVWLKPWSLHAYDISPTEADVTVTPQATIAPVLSGGTLTVDWIELDDPDPPTATISLYTPQVSTAGSTATDQPAGSIMYFGGNAAPAGWIWCDGSPVSRTTYATLFGVIGTLYGPGDGATTFNVPDCRGRALVAALAADPNFGAIGAAGGATTATPPLPVHNHAAASGGQSANHSHWVGPAAGANDGEVAVRAAGSTEGTALSPHTGVTFAAPSNIQTQGYSADHSHAVSVGNAGTGGAISVLQPFLVVGGAVIKT